MCCMLTATTMPDFTPLLHFSKESLEIALNRRMRKGKATDMNRVKSEKYNHNKKGSALENHPDNIAVGSPQWWRNDDVQETIFLRSWHVEWLPGTCWNYNIVQWNNASIIAYCWRMGHVKATKLMKLSNLNEIGATNNKLNTLQTTRIDGAHNQRLQKSSKKSIHILCWWMQSNQKIETKLFSNLGESDNTLAFLILTNDLFVALITQFKFKPYVL